VFENEQRSLLSLDAVTLDAGGTRLIRPVTADIPLGARTVVLGPNGAGKSLLLRLCHGLITPTSGRLEWLPGTAKAPPRQAMVFDRPVLLYRSVAANIRYPLEATRVPRREHAERLREALVFAGLEQRARQFAPTLSAGQKQRLALARAWALRPDVLFLDEPTAHLDLAATRDIETMINAIHHKLAGVILTTHDLAQARRIADHVVFVHKGKVIEWGAADSFFDRPRAPEARRFLNGELFE